ncbi:hypothetical protein COCON_G00002840 [Conger conger]|uniref:Ig-like domain-containing protein n=1 Tax=Conger conger TaxID=82655 RepID=A0A9Q1I891_CONCO|nr:hypothetical protein COCON_G00002840 [Conger conger]
MLLKKSGRLLVVLVVLKFTVDHKGVLGQNGWGVTYAPETICGLNGSSVDMHCNYSYPTSYSVQKTVWFIHQIPHQEPDDLSLDPEYSDRVEYLGDLNNDCTFKIKQLRESDSKTYHFRFLTYNADGKYTGQPGVTLDITALQVIMYPDTVTEGQSVTLNCSTTCNLTGRPAFTWYRDGSPLSFTTQTHQLTASSEDGGRYSCVVKGYEDLPSPAVALSVNYSPKDTSVSNKHGAQNSTGLSVDYAAMGNEDLPYYIIAGTFTAACAAVLIVVAWIVGRRSRSRKEQRSDTEDTVCTVYANVSESAISATAVQETIPEKEEAEYSNVEKPQNQEEVLYSTVQKRPAQCVDEVQYASIQFPQSAAASGSTVPTSEDVIYTTLVK